MMFSTYFLALLLSHLAGDFVFQDDRLCKMKIDSDLKRRLRGVSVHVGIILLLDIIVFRIFISQEIPWIVLILINSFHWILDISKSTIQSKKKLSDVDPVIKRIILIANNSGHMESKNKTNKWTIFLFFGDQVLHLISIFIAAHLLYSFDVSHYMSFGYQFISGTVTVSKSLSLINKVLLVLIYLCLATSVSNVVIKVFLGGLRNDLGADAKTGRYIGGVERILTITIILVGAWQALAVLYGSKTAIRFDQAKGNPDFAEYYILGTSLSALFAVIIAAAMKISLF